MCMHIGRQAGRPARNHILFIRKTYVRSLFFPCLFAIRLDSIIFLRYAMLCYTYFWISTVNAFISAFIVCDPCSERKRTTENKREFISSTLYKNFGWVTLKVKVTVCCWQLFQLFSVIHSTAHTVCYLRFALNKCIRVCTHFFASKFTHSINKLCNFAHKNDNSTILRKTEASRLFYALKKNVAFNLFMLKRRKTRRKIRTKQHKNGLIFFYEIQVFGYFPLFCQLNDFV